MKIHVLQHVPFENPGTILDWAKERHFSLGFTRFYVRDKLPEPDDFDLLIIMGGPMNLADTIKYPWLVQEKEFIKRCLVLEKRMVGICLGAQLLAELLGAKIYRNSQKEIGWFPLRKNKTSGHKILNLFKEDDIFAFHWHGDTFDLPEDARLLFSSKATKNQAFVWKDRIFALQFHWEVKPENIRLLLENAAGDLTSGSFVQQPENMLTEATLFVNARNNLFRFLDFIVFSGTLP